MNYQQTLDFLYSQLPMYQRVGTTAFKKNLNNIKKLTAQDEHSQTNFKSIHIAGTNGKGSVSHILASVLQEAGYKVGLYTSPHLKSYRERIRINGKMIPRNEVVKYVTDRKQLFENVKPSFFEMTVAMAFYYFAKQKVDFAIIETGLGGRLDSTNIITPILSVITNIGFDHTQFLGNTLKEIASEKAGIIKNNVPVVIGETQSETQNVFLEKAKSSNAPIYFADNNFSYQYSPQKINRKQVFNIYKNKELVFENLQTDLLGIYQRKNIITALQALEVLSNEIDIDKTAIYKGLAAVQVNTGFAGRWQILKTKPLIIADTAHNAEGLRETVGQINSLIFNKLHIVMGMVNDKNTKGVLELFPSDAEYYFTKANVPRAMPAEQLANLAKSEGLKGKVYNTVAEAFTAAKNDSTPEDLIYVGGSTFVVAEVLEEYSET